MGEEGHVEPLPAPPGKQIDEAILALFAKLPPVDTVWPEVDRQRWLRAASATIDLVYPPAGPR